MILLDHNQARASYAATTKHTTCPICEGEGERRFNVTRSEWGVWDCDTETCTWCAGTGQVEVVRCQGVESPECDVWFDPRDQLCAHGEPLCDSHRHECGQCMADAKDAS